MHRKFIQKCNPQNLLHRFYGAQAIVKNLATCIRPAQLLAHQHWLRAHIFFYSGSFCWRLGDTVYQKIDILLTLPLTLLVLGYNTPSIGVEASYTMYCLCFDFLIGQKKIFFYILNWNFRYVSWLKQYQTGKFVSSKRCYDCANTALNFASDGVNSPPPSQYY